MTYTHYSVIVDEKYREGHAKAITSALTREATSGAVAGLHIEVDNELTIKAYKNLGYQIIKTRTWVFGLAKQRLLR